MKFRIIGKAQKTWSASSLEGKRYFDHTDIWNLLELLNDELKGRKVVATIKIFGGAAICLSFGENSRNSTTDIDATFDHAADIEDAVMDIAIEYGISEDWLERLKPSLRAKNLRLETFQHLYTFSNLVVYTATPEYILILKLFCNRSKIDKERKDLQDIQYLWKYLGQIPISRVEELCRFYFPDRVFPKEKFLYAIGESSIKYREDL